MYKKKDDLILLVTSLSSGEKRHFFNMFKGEHSSNFWKLFESIKEEKSQMRNFDIDARSLTASKRLLYDNVLKSLRTLHENASIDIRIQNLLTNVELLYNHSLAEQARLVLSKAYSLAIDNEKFGLQIQALDWEKRLNVVLTNAQRSIDAIIQEENEVIEKMLQMKNLESLYSHILNLKRQYGYARGAIKELLDNEILHSPLLPNIENCKSQKARYYYNLILAVYYWMVFEHHLAFEHSIKLTNTNECNVLPNDYINGMLQHITSSVCVVKFQEAIDTIHHSEKYIILNKLDQSLPFTHLMFTYHTIYKMIVYNYMGDTENLSKTVKTSEQLMVQFQNSLPFTNKQVILGNLMNSYLGLNEIDKAEKLWDQLFNKQSKTIRLDIYGDLYLFRLFLLLYTKSFDLIYSAANSAYKFFKKQNDESGQFVLELSIAQLLKKEHDFDNKKQFEILVSQIKSLVDNFIASLQVANNFQEHYTRYVIWSNAILNKTNYAEEAQKWYKATSVQ